MTRESNDAALAAQGDVARFRRWADEARENDKAAAAAAAERGEPAPPPTEPKVRAALAVHERLAMPHSRITALHDQLDAHGAQLVEALTQPPTDDEEE